MTSADCANPSIKMKISLMIPSFIIPTLLSIPYVLDAKAIPPRSPAPASNRFAENDGLVGRALVKRGNCFSKGDDEFDCSSDPPSVDELVQQIQSHGQVGNKQSVFYTGLGGAGGVKVCKQYFTCHPELGQVVLWDDIVDNNWYLAQATAIMTKNQQANTAVDVFQKRLSQAFGVASAGSAYLCTPEANTPNNQFNTADAWGGWEYPALTRNSKVTNVIRVDPSTGNNATIWNQGDPPTANAPAG